MNDLSSRSADRLCPAGDARVVTLPFAGTRQVPDGFPAARAVQAYWEALRGPRLAPARAEIDPRPLADSLDVLFIAEIVAPGVARIRLAGQRLGALLGMEPRGMPLSVFFTGHGREEIVAAVRQVALGARVTLPLRSDPGPRRPPLDAILALLPLTDHAGGLTRVLGVLEPRSVEFGRAPRRFRTRVPSPAQPVPAAPSEAGAAIGARAGLRLIHGGRGAFGRSDR